MSLISCGHIVPGLALVVGRLQVVVDVLEIDADVATPLGHRLRLENLERFEAEIPHPGRFVLHLGNLRDDLRIQALLRLEDVVRWSDEIVLVDLAESVTS